MKRIFLPIGVGCVFLFLSCENQIVSNCDIKNEIPNPPATFTWIQTAVFNSTCVGCHNGPSGNGGLDLSGGKAYGNLINTPSNATGQLRIKPGDSNSSFLMHRLQGSNGQTTMPPAGKLQQVIIDSVAAWINRGAPNN